MLEIVFAWVCIALVSYGFAMIAARTPGVLRGNMTASQILWSVVAMYYVIRLNREPERIVDIAVLIVAIPLIVVYLTSYGRFVRRHRGERLCADCAYALPEESFKGRPCPECGSVHWLIVPTRTSEMYRTGGDTQEWWVPKRQCLIHALMCFGVLVLGAEVSRLVGGAFTHPWLSAGMAIGVWLSFAAIAVGMSVSVRRAADAKRIARDLAEWEARNGAPGSVSGDASEGDGTPPPAGLASAFQPAPPPPPTA